MLVQPVLEILMFVQIQNNGPWTGLRSNSNMLKKENMATTRLTMSLSSEVPLTLITIAFDLHIKICEFLHPSDILALRQVWLSIMESFQLLKLLRLVKPFNLLQSNVQSGLVPSVKYALITLYFYRVFPYPI